MGEVREYAMVRYRLRKHPLGYNAYDLKPARRKLMEMKDLKDFQFQLRMGGHQILSINRLTKEEFENEKKEMRKRKLEREVTKAAAEKEARLAALQVAPSVEG